MPSCALPEKRSSPLLKLWVGLGVILLIGLTLGVFLPYYWIKRDMATEPADAWVMMGNLTATSVAFRILLPAAGDSGDDDAAAAATDDKAGDSNSTEADTAAGTLWVSTDPNWLDTINDTDTVAISYELQNVYDTIYSALATDLEPQTRYYYGVMVTPAPDSAGDRRLQEATDDAAGAADEQVLLLGGTFQTPAPEGTRFPFTVATAGCSLTGSKASIFEVVYKQQDDAHKPLLVIHNGDFHYEDIDSDDVDLRLDAISTALASPSRAGLLQSVPLVYVWDDHDYLGDESDAHYENPEALRVTSPERDAALQSYQVAFPHYPLAAAPPEEQGDNSTDASNSTGSESEARFLATTDVSDTSEGDTSESDAEGSDVPLVPIYHAFTIGTVRFVVSDLRSESITAQSMYSDQQREWLLQEFQNAKLYDFVIWVTSKYWVGTFNPDKPDYDSWGGLADERRLISNAISDFIGGPDGPQNLLAVSSDAHMVAFDDGTNTYYGNNTDDTAVTYSFPIIQAGPWTQMGSAKGGPYTDGCFASKYELNYQYSTVSFEVNDGGEPCLLVQAFRVPHATSMDQELLLEKRMCGKIFKAASRVPMENTCTTTLVSNTSRGWVIAGFFFTFAAGFAVAYGSVIANVPDTLDTRRILILVAQCFGVMLFVWGSYIGTIALVLGVPNIKGVEQLTTPEALTMGFVQSLAMFLWALAWVVYFRYYNVGEMEKEQSNGVGEEPAETLPE